MKVRIIERGHEYFDKVGVVINQGIVDGDLVFWVLIDTLITRVGYKGIQVPTFGKS